MQTQVTSKNTRFPFHEAYMVSKNYVASHKVMLINISFVPQGNISL